jgi:hypothetical protein
VTLRGIRTVTFLSELNGLELWGANIGNAYLKSVTKEKVYIIAGPEFGPRAGHTLIIYKAQYGLRSSGLRWHEKLADVFRSMGFFPSLADKDIWMKDKGDHYEYIAMYVDDLAIGSKAPKEITDELENTYKFKLKGTGPIEFHLGCDFYHDEDGTLCFGPKKYIEKMVDAYMRMFGNGHFPFVYIGASTLEPAVSLLPLGVKQLTIAYSNPVSLRRSLTKTQLEEPEGKRASDYIVQLD